MKIDECTGVPIRSIREMRRMPPNDLIAYYAQLLHLGWERSDALHRAMQQAAQIMMQNQERIRNTPPAPEPRHGWIYVLAAPTGHYKIGRSEDVPARVRTLSAQLPFRVQLVHTIATSDMAWAEWTLHQRFAHCRANGEWFQLADTDLSWLRALDRFDPASEVAR